MSKKTEEKQTDESMNRSQEIKYWDEKKYETFFSQHSAEGDLHFFHPDNPGSVDGHEIFWVPQNAVYTTVNSAFLAGRKVTVWVGKPDKLFEGKFRLLIGKVRESC